MAYDQIMDATTRQSMKATGTPAGVDVDCAALTPDCKVVADVGDVGVKIAMQDGVPTFYLWQAFTYIRLSAAQAEKLAEILRQTLDRQNPV